MYINIYIHTYIYIYIYIGGTSYVASWYINVMYVSTDE